MLDVGCTMLDVSFNELAFSDCSALADTIGSTNSEDAGSASIARS